MKLGFLTACLPDHSLEEIASWAADEGFEALEVAAWPALGQRPFTATHIVAESFGDQQAEEVSTLLADRRLTISSIAYYDNNLHPDPAERRAVNQHVLACVDAAARLGVPTVGTFIGRDWNKSVRENLKEAEEVFKPLVEHAGERQVKLVIENCVMEGWHPDGYPGNLAYSPELWEWMFSLGLYLNFDPSHLVWMGIDPVTAMIPYVDRIAHAQAKDIQLFPEKRDRYGWPGIAVDREDPWDVGWWRYRVPGLGEVDWNRVVDALYEHGYDGVLSVEHEDPVWGGHRTKDQDGTAYCASDPAATDGRLNSRKGNDMKLGYCSITWGGVVGHPAGVTSVKDLFYLAHGDTLRAVREIGEVGYRGVEMFDGNVAEFEGEPRVLTDALQASGLELVSVYTGANFIYADILPDELHRVRRAAQLAATFGAKRLVVGGGARRAAGTTDEDYDRLGRSLDTVCEIAEEHGLEASYHPHLGTIVENPDELEIIMKRSRIAFCPDTAHLAAGGGDPAEIIRRYPDRVKHVHLKDFQPEPFNFLPLGEGVLDLPDIVSAIAEAGYDSWLMVELDEYDGDPQEAARISRNYLEKVLADAGIPCN